DLYVTGVQTCALPIWMHAGEEGADRRALRRPARIDPVESCEARIGGDAVGGHVPIPDADAAAGGESQFQAVIAAAARPFGQHLRSEERRVGKECRCRW